MTNEHYDSIACHAFENRHLKIPACAGMTSVLNISSLAGMLRQNFTKKQSAGCWAKPKHGSLHIF